MTTETAPNHSLARREEGLSPARFNREEVELIRTQICKDLNDGQLALAINFSQQTGLNPLLKQVYFWNDKGRLVIQTGIDGYRITAARTGLYLGRVDPAWCGPDGVWRDVWLAEEPPAACRVGIRRKGYVEPVFATVLYREFQRCGINENWKTRPVHMLAVRAEAHAFRAAFPDAFERLALAEDGEPVPGATVVEEPAPTPSYGQQRATRALQGGEAGSYAAATGLKKFNPPPGAPVSAYRREQEAAGVDPKLALSEAVNALNEEWERQELPGERKALADYCRRVLGREPHLATPNPAGRAEDFRTVLADLERRPKACQAGCIAAQEIGVSTHGDAAEMKGLMAAVIPGYDGGSRKLVTAEQWGPWLEYCAARKAEGTEAPAPEEGDPFVEPEGGADTLL